VAGGKNAILPILASVVLNGDISVIRNCPRISDTFVAIDILRAIGCEVDFEGDCLTVDSSMASNWIIPEDYVREMRSSIIFLGGVLGRFKEVTIAYPGGCEIGRRPIDLHLKGIRELGAEIVEEHGLIICKAKKLRGARVDLTFPSVGATENIMIAAVLAAGETIISGAAKEPEIVDLQNFLISMGADISGAGGDIIVIKGVTRLKKCEYTVMPDRIVAGTYLAAAAITGGDITLENIVPEHIYSIIARLREAGSEIDINGSVLRIKAPERPMAIEELRTLPYPGFPTDAQPQFATLLSIADGTSVVSETVFESRNKHISELARMGANIVTLNGMTSVIKGVKNLHGTTVTSKDLRGGAALILAGLAAKGKTIVTCSEYVERGYEKIEKDLSELGARISFMR
jgi:UDP-N-acetylglucosamine 1-carboxyvinyltransferase